MRIKDRSLNRIINRDVSHLIYSREENLKEENDFIVQLCFDNNKNFTIKQYYMQSDDFDTLLYIFNKEENVFKPKAIGRIDEDYLQQEQEGNVATYKLMREDLLGEDNREYFIKRDINNYIFEVECVTGTGTGVKYNSYIDYMKMSDDEKPDLLKSIIKEVFGNTEHFYGWAVKNEGLLNIYLKENVEMPLT